MAAGRPHVARADRHQDRALAEDWLDQGRLSEIDSEASSAVEEAVTFARSNPFPEPQLPAELVYATR